MRNNPNFLIGWYPRNVDSCIAEEVQRLNNVGIKTVGCCCGHGKQEPTVLVLEESLNEMKEMGYLCEAYSEGTYNCILKTKD